MYTFLNKLSNHTNYFVIYESAILPVMFIIVFNVEGNLQITYKMTKDLKCVHTFCNIFKSHYLKPYIDQHIIYTYIFNVLHTYCKTYKIVSHNIIGLNSRFRKNLF